MQVKVFSDTLTDDDAVAIIKEKYAKKGKVFETIEDRVNTFIQDKDVIHLETHVTRASSLSEAKLVIVVTYH